MLLLLLIFRCLGLFIPASAQPKVTNLTPFSEAQSRTFASSTINTDDQGTSGISSKLVLTGYPSHFSEGDITYLMNDLMKSYGFSNSTSEGKAVKSVRKSEKEAFIEVNIIFLL